MTNDTAAYVSKLSCSVLSDALDRLGIVGQCLGIKPLDLSFSLVGRAWTLRYCSIEEGSGMAGGNEYIDNLGPGDVVVIDNSTRMDATVWGDLLTFVALRRGVSGTVIDGVCRDLNNSIELNYPIFSRGTCMRSGKGRVRVEATQLPVSIGGVLIQPGDWLRGDGDGLVAVPKSRIEEVLSTASEINSAEENFRNALVNGASFRDARHKFGYQQLQPRRT